MQREADRGHPVLDDRMSEWTAEQWLEVLAKGPNEEDGSSLCQACDSSFSLGAHEPTALCGPCAYEALDCLAAKLQS
jgi:hypothetical protein